MNIRPDFQVHGHRGCRGLYPENTLPAFEMASRLGVDAIELDIVISKDSRVVVSHEPYFSHLYSTSPEGKAIKKYIEKKHNLYELTVDEIQTYDVGLRRHKDFPSQKEIACYKPTLQEAVRHIDAIRKKQKQAPMHYSIEIKRKKRWDDKFHPSAKPFVDLVLSELRSLKISKRSSLLCFDLEVLEYIHRMAPDIQLVYLVDNLYSIERNMNRLTFTPDVYGPKFSLVDKKSIQYCNTLGIDIVCWTVNRESDMKKLIRMGIKGITTDFPDILMNVIGKIK